MKELNQNILNARKDKHFKLSQRFLKMLKGGSFKNLSKRKQYTIIERLKRLERQLKDYSNNSKLILNYKHWAVALALGVVSYTASAQDQPKGPEKKSPFGVERERNKEDLEKNYLRANSANPGARTTALGFELAASLGTPPVDNAAVGDFDGDGDIDLIYSPEGLAKIYQLKNYGDFSFQHESLNLETYLDNPVVGDFDGDGDLDILIEIDGIETQYVTLLLNDGSGVFTESSSQIALSSDSYYMRIGDIDGDGDLDFVNQNWYTSSLEAGINDGTGVFTSVTIANDISRLYDLGDMDGDGDLDILVQENYKVYDQYGGYYTNQRETILLNEGGQFSSSQVNLFEAYSQRLHAIDIDSDGDTDILHTTSSWDGYKSTFSLEVFLNDGQGIFPTTPSSQIILDDYVYQPQFVDLDGDTDLDIIIDNYGNAGSPALLNDGTGNFTSTSLAVSPGAQAVGDLDGDGDVDILSFSYANADSWRNDGSLQFTLIQSNIIELSTTASVGILDLNGDGAGEILQFGATKVWRNNGDSKNFTVGQRISSIVIDHELTDVDGDGDLDVVGAIYSTGNHIANVWINSNDGTLTQADSLGIENASEGYRITAGDIDGDGDADLAILSDGKEYSDQVYGSDLITFWFNNGSGQFTLNSTHTIPDTIQYSDIKFASMDADGDLDLVIVAEDNVYSETGSSGIIVATNDGSGGFTFGDRITTGYLQNNFERMAIADFDNDSDMDVFLLNSGGASYVFLNNGDATFTNTMVEALSIYDEGNVVAGDMDNDGDTDIVVSYYSFYGGKYYSEKAVLLNDGAGNFTDSGISMRTLGYGIYGLNIGDIDNDGDLDVVAGSLYSPLELWHNSLLQVNLLDQDKQALTALYNTMDGENWTENANWLSEDVSSWHGVTVENGRVTFLQLPDNNLSGEVSETLLNLSALTHLDLSGNNLTGIPDLSAITTLIAADVSENKLDFGDLEPNADVAFLIYSPQAEIGVQEVINAAVHSEATFSENIAGTANVYQWYFQDAPLANETNPELVITDVTAATMGDYKVEVTNEIVRDLTLTSVADRLNATAGISGILKDGDGSIIQDADVVLLKLTASDGFDTVATVNPNGDGYYSFEEVILAQYQILSDPDVAVNPDLLPTFYPNFIFWEDADTVNLTDNLTGMDITLETFIAETLEGTGEISGTILEEDEEGGRLQVRKRVAGAGVSVRRKIRSGRKTPGAGKMLNDYELVAYLKSNENGEFVFNNLPEDIYRLNIQYPGYPMDTTSFVDISIGQDSQGSPKENDQVAVEALVTGGKIIVKNVTVLSVTDDLYLTSVKVYPNPTTGILYINNLEEMMGFDAGLYDIKGKMILNRKISGSSGEIDLTSLEKGTYILKLFFDDESNVVIYKIILD